MAGKKGAKHYSAEMSKEMDQYKAIGLTHQEIGDRVSLSRTQVKKYFERQHKRERAIENGYIPKPKGRPRKRPMTPEDRIRELEREVELLRAFLHAAGRM